MSDTNSTPILRRDFLEGLGKLSLGAVAAGGLGTAAASSRQRQTQKQWKPVSSRKVRVGIVGYGVCRFGRISGPSECRRGCRQRSDSRPPQRAYEGVPV